MNASHAYRSLYSINCHEGFCRYDLVSYNPKHNEAIGHSKTDGSDYHLSWNCGGEGDENVPTGVMQALTSVVREGRPQDWFRAVETGRPGPQDICEPEAGLKLQGLDCRVGPRSTVVLIRR